MDLFYNLIYGGLMKKLLIIAIITLFAFGARVDAAEMKIGYVDLNKALNKSTKGEKAITLLEDMVKSKQTVIIEKEKELKRIDEEIAKQASILNPDAIKEKHATREKLMRDYQRMVKDSQDDVQKKRNDFMENIVNDLRKTVAAIGKEEGYTIIFERVASGILYIPEDTDLTDKLIKKFNDASK
jgi:outer membrane protein